MSLVALLMVAKIWKQPQCPTMDKSIQRMIYSYENYPAGRKNVTLPFATMWMGLEGIMQSEVSQNEKDKHYMISHICGIYQQPNSKEQRVEWCYLRLEVRE